MQKKRAISHRFWFKKTVRITCVAFPFEKPVAFCWDGHTQVHPKVYIPKRTHPSRFHRLAAIFASKHPKTSRRKNMKSKASEDHPKPYGVSEAETFKQKVTKAKEPPKHIAAQVTLMSSSRCFRFCLAELELELELELDSAIAKIARRSVHWWTTWFETEIAAATDHGDFSQGKKCYWVFYYDCSPALLRLIAFPFHLKNGQIQNLLNKSQLLPGDKLQSFRNFPALICHKRRQWPANSRFLPPLGIQYLRLDQSKQH